MSDLTTTFTNIANAIRSKTGSSDTMTPSEMPDEIAGIETPMDSINITQNGTYEPGAGRGYNQVIVEVPEPTLITKSITANGTYNASEDNADGYSQVTFAVEGFKKKSIANTPTDIASFDDGTANPMPSLEISIEPVQSGSGDPSPQNVRPISGWSGAKIYDDSIYGGVIDFNQIIPNDVMHIESSSAFNWTGVFVTNIISLISGHKYYASLLGTTVANGEIGLRDSVAGIAFRPNTGYSFIYASASNTTNTTTIQGKWDAGTTNAYVNFIDLTQLFGETKANEIYAMEQATAGAGVAYFRNLFPKDYYSYNAGEITTVSAVNGDVDKYSITTIPFHDSSDNPITVYGGRLNVTTGELTVDRAMAILDGSEAWRLQSINDYGIANFYITFDHYRAANFKSLCNMLLSQTSLIGSTKTEGYYIHENGSEVFIRIFSSRASTVEEFKTWLASNPIQLVYELATPQTYQLTPAQVTTLLNQNNIFADCGQILQGEYFVTL